MGPPSRLKLFLNLNLETKLEPSNFFHSNISNLHIYGLFFFIRATKFFLARAPKFLKKALSFSFIVVSLNQMIITSKIKEQCFRKLSKLLFNFFHINIYNGSFKINNKYFQTKCKKLLPSIICINKVGLHFSCQK
jgi:hypothetical protein